MATYEITSPSGGVYEVDAPDDASEDDIRREVRRQEASQREKESGFQDFFEGVGLSGLETYYGLKDLFVGTDEEDKATLEDWRQDAGQSGYGTAGRIAGEIGQVFVPGGAAIKGVKAAQKVSKLAKAAQATKKSRALTKALADTAGATAYGYARAPDIGETRGENAQTELVGSILGEGAGYGLSKAMRGLAKTPAAERLLSEGIRLTPGKASSNVFVRGMETVGEVTPLVAQGVKRSQARAEREIAEKALQKAAAPGKAVTKSGTEGISQIKQGYKEAYSDAWKDATSLSNESRKAFIDTALAYAPKLSKSQKRAVKGVLDDFKDLTSNITPEKFKNLDNELRKKISSAGKKDYELSEALTELRKTLREGAPESVSTKLSDIDKNYGSYLVARRAAKNAAGTAGEFEPNALIGAVKAIGKDRAGEGTAPLQEFATDAALTAGQKVGGQPLEFFRRLAGITYTPLPMQAGGRAVLGQTAPQKAAAAFTDKFIPDDVLRPGLYGATMRRNEEDENK